jgi:hypothetical protein
MIADHDDRTIETIFRLLRARSEGATICPSEVARELAPSRWRPLMPHVRNIAVQLASCGRLEIRQRGELADFKLNIKGPIRLGLPRR